MKVGLKTHAHRRPSVIKVSGFDSSVDEDVLAMYFENTTRSGGGEIQCCKIDPSTNAAVITFVEQGGKGNMPIIIFSTSVDLSVPAQHQYGLHFVQFQDQT